MVSYDSDTQEEIDSLKRTTTTYPTTESENTSTVEQNDATDERENERNDERENDATDEQENDATDERDDEPATPQWRRLTVTLSAAGIDSLPKMVIHATHPTYSVRELPVNDAGRCTLWLPETVDTLDVVLSFPETEQNDISVTDIVVEEQDTITIPIVILSEEL